MLINQTKFFFFRRGCGSFAILIIFLFIVRRMSYYVVYLPTAKTVIFYSTTPPTPTHTHNTHKQIHLLQKKKMIVIEFLHFHWQYQRWTNLIWLSFIWSIHNTTVNTNNATIICGLQTVYTYFAWMIFNITESTSESFIFNISQCSINLCWISSCHKNFNFK